jgi:hypothetical protein
MTYPTNPDDAVTRPTYLRNITQALYLDTSNNVTVRTGFAGNIDISGNVNIPGNINANVYRLGNVDISGSTMPVSGNVTIAGGNVNAAVVGNIVVTSGNVNAAVSGTVSVSSGNINVTGGNIAVTQNTSPWVVSGNVNATLQGTSSVSFAPEATDAFGRLRVSEPFTLFDTNARYYDHGQFDSSTNGTATVTYSSNSSTFNLAIGAANGDSIIRETKRVFPYQPGKSLLIYNTFAMNTPKANLRQRVGFFGAQNGIFFEVSGTTLNMVIRSSSTGTLTEDRVPQSSWNGDRLNGAGGVTNPSGITLDPSRTQIFFTDVEWLGVGSVRCGFVINGVFYTCHTFHHANQPSNPAFDNKLTYMTTATLPIRYEITNVGAVVGTSQMTQICSSVISEGGYNNFGTTQSAGTGTTQKRLSAANTYYPIVSIRLAPTRLDSIVFPRQIDVLSPSVNYYRWVLLQNATLTGATFASTSPTGTVQIDTAATAVSGGIEIQSGYAASRELAQLSAVDFFQFQLGRTIAGVSDVVTLAIAATANNADVLSELGWQELS